MAVTLLPELALPRRHPGVVRRALADGPAGRTILAATRATDAARPSTQAVLAAVREAATVVRGDRPGPADAAASAAVAR
jgi:hypothetical protein